MNELSCEYVVHKEKTGKDKAVTAIKCAAVVLAALALMIAPIGFGIYTLILPGVAALGAAIWGCTRFISKTNIDYEYSFADTSSEMSIDKIIDLSDRRTLAVVPAKEIVEAGVYDPKTFSVKDVKVEWYCGSTEPADPVYYVYNQNGKKQCVVVERDERVFGAVKRAMPVAVYRDGFLRK